MPEVRPGKPKVRITTSDKTVTLVVAPGTEVTIVYEK